MFKKILLGLDSSEDASKAVEKVIEIQQKFNSEVVVFHSVLHNMADLRPAFPGSPDTSTIISYEIHEDRRKAAIQLVEDVEAKFKKANVPVETRLIFDYGPQYYIVDTVMEENFDLVVLGCRGEHSKLKRTLIGTVPEYVINHIDTDVLIVK